MRHITKITPVLTGAFAIVASSASAHLPPGIYGSVAAGFSHPLSGADHILTMVAVGLWASMLGGRAIIAVPATFVLTMLAGFVLAMAGVPVPFVEQIILASVIVLGLLVALSVTVDMRIGMAIVAVFALCHGHAHGAEMGQAGALRFMFGFGVATIMLHVIGIGFGLLIGRNRMLARIMGAGAALTGVMLAIS